ncbi:MAG: TnpV protein [Anaerovoracaceae bacterium]
MKKHIYDEKNRLYYTLADDGMYYPDLELPKEDNTWVGKYGLMRERFLQEHKHNLYMTLYLSGKLTKHLLDINEQAQNQVDEIVYTTAKAEGCNEDLKAKDQMKWVGLMNNYKACAEEVVLREIVYR